MRFGGDKGINEIPKEGEQIKRLMYIEATPKRLYPLSLLGFLPDYWIGVVEEYMT